MVKAMTRLKDVPVRYMASALALGLVFLLAACNEAEVFVPVERTTVAPKVIATIAGVPPFSLTSPAFIKSAPIPTRHTCDGDGVSPPLVWEGAPPGTMSFVLIADDLDAANGGVNHWVLFNIPATARSLPEAIAATEQSPAYGLQGSNGAGRSGFQSACPPPGPAHRYQFTLSALDRTLSLPVGATKEDVRRAMDGRELARVELTGVYQRPQR
jgi:Raf kinase inhibitor-like YbhB/YbcL family protein